uniref:Uncharacterized protein n=1 Tax=Pyrodinium bahamense TaxID=73915 RepID=A0A7R9ZZU2_9DINO
MLMASNWARCPSQMSRISSALLDEMILLLSLEGAATAPLHGNAPTVQKQCLLRCERGPLPPATAEKTAQVTPTADAADSPASLRFQGLSVRGSGHLPAVTPLSGCQAPGAPSAGAAGGPTIARAGRT